MKDSNKNSLHLSFESENLAFPEIHVKHANEEGTAEQNKSAVPKEIKEYFAADRFASRITGIEIEETSNNYSRCSLHVTEDHRNLAGDVMGGVLFTLANFSFAVAASKKPHYTTTLTSEIRFMAKMKGDMLYSECRVVRDGGRICFADAVITDKTGGVVATASISGMHIS